MARCLPRALALPTAILCSAGVCLAALCAGLASSAQAVQITEFPLATGSQPLFITPGPEGDLWFTDVGTNKIGRISTSGQVTEFGLGLTPEAELSGIASGPDGNLWFTERNGHKVGRITPQGVVTEFSAGLAGNPDIYDIAAGPNGELWFTEPFTGKIGTINPVTGQIAEVAAPGEVLTGLTEGPEGNVWYTDSGKGLIYRLAPTGTPTKFGPLPTSECAEGAPTPCPYPDTIVVGSDGNLWFNETRGNAIGRITPGGDIAEYSSGLSHGAAVKGLAVGPEGNIWFAEEGASQVGRITPAGQITEFHSGLAGEAAPFDIALGSDGNLWLTERLAGKIARITPEVPPVVATGGSSAVTSATAVVYGTVRSRGADTHYYFEYGTTPQYGGTSPSQDNGAGDTTTPVSAALSGLRPATVYHYRVLAANASGTTYGSDQAFLTAPAPPPPPQVTVGPFEMFFSGTRSGRGHLRLSRIVVILLAPHERVSYTCSRCRGSSRRGARVTGGHRLTFAPRRLTISTRSRLKLTVTAPNGSSRTRTYVFDIRRVEGVLVSQRCHLLHVRTPVVCPP